MGMSFTRGVFYKFRAKASIHLGALQRNIEQGDELEYDGQTMKLHGTSYHIPALASAINEKWFDRVEDDAGNAVPSTPDYRAKPAAVPMRPAQSTGRERGEVVPTATASEEERVVGTIKNRADGTSQAPAKAVKSAARLPVDAPDMEVRTVKNPARLPVDAQDQPSARKKQAAAPEGAPRRALTVAEADEINMHRFQQERAKPMEDVEASVWSYNPPPPAPEEEKRSGNFQVVADQQDAIEVTRYQLRDPKQRADLTKMSVAAVEASVRPVAKTPQREDPAFRATHVSSEGNEDISGRHANGATGDVEEARSGERLTELVPGAMAGPDPSNPLGWDLSAQWKNRVKTAVDRYGQDPDALRQIMSIETDAVRKHIGIALKQLHGK